MFKKGLNIKAIMPKLLLVSIHVLLCASCPNSPRRETVK